MNAGDPRSVVVWRVVSGSSNESIANTRKIGHSKPVSTQWRQRFQGAVSVEVLDRTDGACVVVMAAMVNETRRPPHRPKE
jgi:hypothetical protein